MLHNLGYQVIEAADEQDAVNISEGHRRIDILMTDIVMPDIGGPQLADRIPSIRPDIKVFFMSGYTGGALNYHVQDQPEIHLLKKPFTPESMAAKLRKPWTAEQPGGAPSF
jgi:CheY-like chemotaxis protein